MITMKVWKCGYCGSENKFSEPSIMIVMEKRDYCHRCGKVRREEIPYRMRVGND